MRTTVISKKDNSAIVRRRRAADGRTCVQLRKFPPPQGRWAGKSGRARALVQAQKRHSFGNKDDLLTVTFPKI